MATQNVQLALPPYNASNWNSPLNGNFTIIDAVFGNTKTITVTGADYALTVSDLQNLRIAIAGNNGGSDITVRFPGGVGGSWIVTNNAFTSGGKVFLATSTTSIPGIQIPATGSLLVFSDGANLYSAVSGSQGNYLPTTGGTITGDLGVNGKLGVGNLATFQGGLTVSSGTATFGDVKVNGSFDLGTTNLKAATVVAGGGTLGGSDKLAVGGSANINGDLTVNGSVRVPLGSLNVSNTSASNSLSGATTIPTSSSFTIRTGATFTIESGANLSLNGEFKPVSVSTGDITSSSKVVCTGPGGFDAGSAPIKTSGAVTAGSSSVTGDSSVGGKLAVTGNISGSTISVSGAANFNSTGVFAGDLTSARRVTASTDMFINPSSGNANLYMAPQDKGVLGTVFLSAAPDAVYFGFFNAYATGVNAFLNMQNGKWIASGGVGVGITNLPSTITNIPGVVTEENGQPVADVGAILAHLIQEISYLKSELSALKKL